MAMATPPCSSFLGLRRPLKPYTYTYTSKRVLKPLLCRAAKPSIQSYIAFALIGKCWNEEPRNHPDIIEFGDRIAPENISEAVAQFREIFRGKIIQRESQKTLIEDFFVALTLLLGVVDQLLHFVNESFIWSHIFERLNLLTSGLGSGIMCGATAAAFVFLQAAAPISSGEGPVILGLNTALAVLYSPDTKVPRSAEVALRRSIPVVNPNMRKIQDSLEDIFYLLRIPQRKPYGSMEGDVKKALQLAIDEKASILSSVLADDRENGAELYEMLVNGKNGLQGLLDAIAARDPDKVSIKLASSLDAVARLELLQAPGLPFLLPAQYQGYPRLVGRATIEFDVERGDGSTFTIAAGGGPQNMGKIEVVLDGYSAPLTSGNFIDLVLKGAFDGMKLQATPQAIISGSENDTVGNSLPLEIMPAGEFQPLYRTTLSVQDGELPVLPLSVYGAVAMAHSANSEDFSAPSQFFFYLYDKRNAGLGGLAFDEGQFSVFGYVTKGRELLSQIKNGDIIHSAKLISGADHFVLPSSTSVS